MFQVNKITPYIQPNCEQIGYDDSSHFSSKQWSLQKGHHTNPHNSPFQIASSQTQNLSLTFSGFAHSHRSMAGNGTHWFSTLSCSRCRGYSDHNLCMSAFLGKWDADLAASKNFQPSDVPCKGITKCSSRSLNQASSDSSIASSWISHHLMATRVVSQSTRDLAACLSCRALSWDWSIRVQEWALRHCTQQTPIQFASVSPASKTADIPSTPNPSVLTLTRTTPNPQMSISLLQTRVMINTTLGLTRSSQVDWITSTSIRITSRQGRSFPSLSSSP